MWPYEQDKNQSKLDSKSSKSGKSFSNKEIKNRNKMNEKDVGLVSENNQDTNIKGENNQFYLFLIFSI